MSAANQENNCLKATRNLRISSKGKVVNDVQPEEEDISKLSFRGVKGQDIIDSFYRCYGILSLVVADLDIKTKKTEDKSVNYTCPLKNYIKVHPILQKHLQESRSGIVDKAEKVMIDLMDSDSEKIRYEATRYILDRLGGSTWMGNKLQHNTTIQITQQEDAEKKKKILQIFNINQPQEEKTLLDISDDETRDDANIPQTNIINIDLSEEKKEDDIIESEIIDVQNLN